jgi:hypothetical protein
MGGFGGSERSIPYVTPGCGRSGAHMPPAGTVSQTHTVGAPHELAPLGPGTTRDGCATDTRGDAALRDAILPTFLHSRCDDDKRLSL